MAAETPLASGRATSLLARDGGSCRSLALRRGKLVLSHPSSHPLITRYRIVAVGYDKENGPYSRVVQFLRYVAHGRINAIVSKEVSSQNSTTQTPPLDSLRQPSNLPFGHARRCPPPPPNPPLEPQARRRTPTNFPKRRRPPPLPRP